MSFDAYTPKVPLEPDRITLHLSVTEAAGGSRTYGGTFDFALMLDEETVIERRSGDLRPHLPDGAKADLKRLLDWALDRAKSTVG